MVNTGGWLILTATFSILLLLIQRSERKRRMVTTVIMAAVALVVWRYAIYRMSTECTLVAKAACSFASVRGQMAPYEELRNTAIRTVNWSIVSALIFNLLFWVLIGRSNPPGSSDSIKVLGMDD
jgi:predicted cobalt transporter CbtA